MKIHRPHLRRPHLRRPTNPVLARELKERMRSRRTFVVLTLYLGVLATAGYLIYTSAARRTSVLSGGSEALASASIGRTMFETILIFMVLLVLFIVPGMTAGAIAGERERRTLAPLQITLLGPRSILLGKLGASLAYGVFLVVATLPLVSVAFVVGGVTVSEIVRGTLMVILIAITVACIALCCSTLIRTVQPAMLVSYALVLVLIIGTFITYGAQTLLRNADSGSGKPNKAVLVLNPLLATADVVRGESVDRGGVIAPLGSLQELVGRDREIVATFPVPQAGGFVVPQQQQQVDSRIDRGGWNILPFWAKSTLVYAVICVLAFLLSSRKLRTPSPVGSFT